MTWEADERGYKPITIQNLVEPDITQVFNRGGTEGWVSIFHEVKLSDKVPSKIVGLFEVARGAMIYGWFYYPLLTLATEQCYRIVESAVRIKCEEIGVKTKRKISNGDEVPVSFFKLQDALFSQGVLEQKEGVKWEALRELRNWASHPESQAIMTPGNALDTLRITADQLHDLFK